MLSHQTPHVVFQDTEQPLKWSPLVTGGIDDDLRVRVR
jgi:hypothetical protein